jgi:hypothetical protein
MLRAFLLDRYSASVDTLHRPTLLQRLQIAPHGRGADLEALCQLRNPGSALSGHQVGHSVSSFSRQRRSGTLVHCT